jgi:cold shock CspA family protein
MLNPMQVDFKGFKPNEMQRTAVRERVKLIEEQFDQIRSGHVIIAGPSGHHQTGGLYEITIRLTLPTGKEVDVSRTPHLDERHSDFHFALNDAFKRARRQLQDQVRHLQGEVKTHVAPASGKVTKLFEGHGFLESKDGLEIYFHKNSVLNNSFSKLKIGSQVTFSEEQGENGPQASTVKL